MMLRPGGESFQVAGLLPLIAALAYAFLQILTRKIGIKDKASTMSFYIQAVFLVVCSAFGLLFGDGRSVQPTNGFFIQGLGCTDQTRLAHHGRTGSVIRFWWVFDKSGVSRDTGSSYRSV